MREPILSRYRYRLVWIGLSAVAVLAYGGYQLWLEGRVATTEGDVKRIQRTIQRPCNAICKDKVVKRVLRELRNRGVKFPPAAFPDVIGGPSIPPRGQNGASVPATTTTTNGPTTTPSTSGDGPSAPPPSPSPPAPSPPGSPTPNPPNPSPAPPNSGVGDALNNVLPGQVGDQVEQTTDQLCSASQQVLGLCL